ncbi:MFS transporter [Paenibacillus sp. CC-CFT747]|nr:MFS transporter [Paenibacillus sp. CC-CFT747]
MERSLGQGHTEREEGAVWGFFLTIEGLGTTIGPIVSGWLSDWINIRASFIGSGVVLFLLLVMQWFIRFGKRATV